MKISVKVKTKAKENKVEEIDKNQFIVKVKVPPVENKANKEIVEILAQYFKVPKSQVSIISGLKSTKKIVSIGDKFPLHF